MMQDADGTTVTPIDSQTAWAQLWYSHASRDSAGCAACELTVTTAIRDEERARYEPIVRALQSIARGGYIEEAQAALIDFFEP